MTLALFAQTSITNYLVTAEDEDSLFHMLKNDFIDEGEDLAEIEYLFAVDCNVYSLSVEKYIAERIKQEEGI